MHLTEVILQPISKKAQQIGLKIVSNSSSVQNSTMKNLKFPLYVAVLSVFAFVGFRAIMVTEWTIVAENVSITIEGKSTSGTISGLEADIHFTPAELADSRFRASVNTASLDLGNKLQTKHATSDNWMDIETFPTASFTSKEIRTTEAGYETVGDLELHGVTKEITMPFTFEKTDEGGIFKGSMHIEREDFNIGKGKFVPEVDVTIEVPVMRSQEK
jgi:polyisoprenoid-binding protein YceI